MNEMFCVAGLICQVANPRPICPQYRTQPENEQIVNCVTPENPQEYQRRNQGVFNQPNGT